MKMSKTAQNLLADANKGIVYVEWGFHYGREFGKRKLAAAEELVKAGKLVLLRRSASEVKKNGFIRSHGVNFSFAVV